MNRKILTCTLAGILSVLPGCVSNENAIEGSNNLLSLPPSSFVPRREVRTEELDIYKRGPVHSETSTGYILSYPLSKRRASEVIEPFTKMFPDCTLGTDPTTNQIFVRIPYSASSPDIPKDTRLKEARKFIEDLDLDVPVYVIHSWIMEVYASKLDRVSAGLDVLLESHDASFALNTVQSDRGPRDRGIQHTLSGIFGSSLPTAQLDILFSGLKQQGYIESISFTSGSATEGSQTKVSYEKGVPMPQLLPQVNTTFVGYTHKQLPNSLTAIAKSRANNMVELDLDIERSNTLPSPTNFQPYVPIPDTFSRKSHANVIIPLGGLYLVSSTLDEELENIDESSPVSRAISSKSSEKGTRRFELTAVTVERIDTSKPSGGWAAEQLEKKMNGSN